MFFYIRDFARRFTKTEDGATSIEYAILLALIIAVCVVAAGTLGSKCNEVFDYLQPPESPQWNRGR